MSAAFDFNLHALRAEIAPRVQSELSAALEAGKLSLPVDKVFALDEALSGATPHAR
jgi:hypothetical protein